jgi:hypothetical protein
VSVVGCQQCVYRRECGGLDEQQQMFGCFESCANCDPDRCDWACPNNPAVFQRRWLEVGGLNQGPPGPLLPIPKAVQLPDYIPVIQHGYSRRGGFSAPVIAVPMHSVLGRKGNTFRALASGPADLRRRFGLAPNSRVLIVSAAEDPKIEQYWKHARKTGIGEEILRLGVLGMTVPNFSFYENGPRPQTLVNRYRMMRSAEALSEMGVPIIPHLNAVTENDWTFWKELLRDQPGIRVVAKEFHTGLITPDRGLQAVEDLARLRDSVRQELHPIIIAGARFIGELARLFKESFTIADSVPFSQTVMGRRRAIIRPDRSLDWRPEPTPRGQPLDDRLRYNFAAYRDWLAGNRQLDDVPSGRQTSLPFWAAETPAVGT